jgi:hypothetical protein
MRHATAPNRNEVLVGLITHCSERRERFRPPAILGQAAVRSSEQGAEAGHLGPMLFGESLTAGEQVLVEKYDGYDQCGKTEESEQH